MSGIRGGGICFAYGARDLFVEDPQLTPLAIFWRAAGAGWSSLGKSWVRLNLNPRPEVGRMRHPRAQSGVSVPRARNSDAGMVWPGWRLAPTFEKTQEGGRSRLPSRLGQAGQT
jgi:hypothetical protein